MNKKAFVLTFSFLLVLSGILVFGVSGATSEEVVSEENGAFFDPEIIDYTDEVVLGDTIMIEYTVTNIGDANGTQDIILRVEVELVGRTFEEEVIHEDVTLVPGEEFYNEYTYDTNEDDLPVDIPLIELTMDVTVTLETEDASDSVEGTITKPGQIPGFTFTLLVIGVIFAVVIYHTKKR